MAKKRRNTKSRKTSSTHKQDVDRAIHDTDCEPDCPIITAHHLHRAVMGDLLPNDPQTLEDYGFNKAITGKDQCMLLGLYAGLIKYMEVRPKTLHQWRVNGTLVQEIKAVYERIPAGWRGGYYPWFLENQYVLDGSGSHSERMAAYGKAAIKRAWQFTVGSAPDSADTIQRKIATMPKEKQDCHFLYRMLVNDMHPGPGVVGWVEFGFCATRYVWEEMDLGRNYRALIERCSFEEFCTAYKASSLLRLFHSKGIRPTIPHLEDVLQGTPYVNKSVWNLKEFVMCECHLRPSVWVDYGFANCRTEQDTVKLKKVYAKYFEHPEGDPIALHNAAIRGCVFEHIGGVIKLSNEFKTMMQNPYPLIVKEDPVLNLSKPVVCLIVIVIVVFMSFFYF